MKVSDFPTRLKEAMDSRGLRAVNLVEKTGFSKSKISQYMNGVHLPKQNAIYILASVLKVDEGWLMGYDCSMKRKPLSSKKQAAQAQNKQALLDSVNSTFGTQAQELLYSFVKLNQTGKEKLVSYMNDLLSNPRNSKR